MSWRFASWANDLCSPCIFSASEESACWNHIRCSRSVAGRGIHRITDVPPLNKTLKFTIVPPLNNTLNNTDRVTDHISDYISDFITIYTNFISHRLTNVIPDNVA